MSQECFLALRCGWLHPAAVCSLISANEFGSRYWFDWGLPLSQAMAAGPLLMFECSVGQVYLQFQTRHHHHFRSELKLYYVLMYSFRAFLAPFSLGACLLIAFLS